MLRFQQDVSKFIITSALAKISRRGVSIYIKERMGRAEREKERKGEGWRGERKRKKVAREEEGEREGRRLV